MEHRSLSVSFALPDARRDPPHTCMSATDTAPRDAIGEMPRCDLRDLLGEVRALLTERFGMGEFTVDLRRDPSDPDLRLIVSPGALATGDPEAALEALRALTGVAGAELSRPHILVTLDEELLATMAERVAGGTVIAGVTASPTPHMVGFIGANACKPLHIGHLRNAILGNALIAALRRAGYDASCYSIVGDIGRSVCEALVGYMQVRGELDIAAGEKADKAIGRLYSAYVTEHDLPDVDEGGDPIARENVIQDDPADHLLRRWIEGDAEVRAVWREMVDLILAAQIQTLGDLGITVDRWWPEADHVELAADLGRMARDEGIAGTEANGTIAFHTGRPEFRVLPLMRSDGFPTEHARLMSIFVTIFAEHREPLVHIDVTGDEWREPQAAAEEILRALGLIPERVVHDHRTHGMVTVHDAKLSSRTGDSLLMDDLLADLRQAEPTRALAALSGGAVSSEAVADIVLKTYVLNAPPTKTLDWKARSLMDPAFNPGWIVAEAWSRSSGAGPSSTDDIALTPELRLLLFQAMELSVALERVIADRDPRHGSRFLVRFSKMYLRLRSTSDHVHGMARSILETALKGLGYTA